MARSKVYTKVSEVGVRKFRAELSRWLDLVSRGGEVVVTERGRPVARVIGASRTSRLDELMAAGIIKPAKRPKEPIQGPLIKARGSVSDFVIEQRR